MKNESNKIFRENLERLLIEMQTYNALANRLGVADSTLKSWMNGYRAPSLKMLDKIANTIGCASSDLIKPNAAIQNQGIYTNNSHNAFVRNLNIVFLRKQCFTVPQKLNLLNNVITDFALTSYNRKVQYKLPPLAKLDQIANELDVLAYKLLEENAA